jgi:hypothetical protein
VELHSNVPTQREDGVINEMVASVAEPTHGPNQECVQNVEAVI